MDKNVSDYYDQLYELYPEVPKEDIKRILNFGWRQFLRLSVSNIDLRIEDKEMWCYIGKLYNDTLEHFENYTIKLASKIRMLYKKYKVSWNGYYYFAINDNQYEEYLNQTKKRRGRPKRNIVFGKIKLYKIKEECEVSERMKKYIFQVPLISDDLGFTFIKDNFISDKAKLIIERDPLKFKDLMLINKEYNYAKATSS